MSKSLLLAISLCMSAHLAHAECSSNSQLQKSVTAFSANNVSIVEAILMLGEEQHLCFGIEYVDRHSLLDPISLAVKDITVEGVLREVLKHGKGYEFKEAYGTILVTNINLPHGNRNLFDHVVPTFVTPRARVQEVGNALWMQVQVDLNPEITGFAGRHPTGDPEDIIDAINEHFTPVRSILNLIVVKSKGASWIARRGRDQLGDILPSGLWQILQYDRPISSYTSLLHEIGRQIPDDTPLSSNN